MQKINLKNKYMIIAVAIVVILISSAVTYSLITLINEEEKTKETQPTTPITQMLTKTYQELKVEGLLNQTEIVDDRISPLAPQAIFFEVNRIRHRGLTDLIMNKGTDWKQQPQYYYTLKIDDFTHNSKDVHAPTGYEEILFQGWDTMFQETRRVQSPEEGQETSDITLTIIERKNTGLLGRKTEDIEMENIHLTYCYRTGRWTGDNYFGHEDGYGHYVGDKFEVWFDIGQTCYANDGIPYWTKVNILGLDPLIDYSDKDLDNDGIPVEWEWKWGYNPFEYDDHEYLDPDIDGLYNTQEYKLRKYFADPLKPDMYVEVDGMKKGGIFDWDHKIDEETIQIITEKYTEHGMNVYMDNGWPGTPANAGGEMLDHVITIDQDSGMQNRFYRHHFPDERKGLFRYLIICDGGGHSYPSDLNRMDTQIVGTNLKLVLTSRMAFTPRQQILSTTSLVMHELGHSQGLSLWTFEGVDNYTIYPEKAGILNSIKTRKAYAEKWGTYESSMNYLYAGDSEIVGYSDGSNGAPYDQDDWSRLYIPYFKLEADAIEDPTLYFNDQFEELPGMEVMQRAQKLPMDLDIPPLSAEDMRYDEELTTKYEEDLSEIVQLRNAPYDIRVYVDNTSSTNHFVRVYAKPDLGETHYSEWSLIAEGTLKDSDLVINHALWNL